MIVQSLSFLPSVNSNDLSWIEFHKQLRKEVGRTNANSLWVKAWVSRKNEGLLGSLANTSNLRDYMEKQDVTLSADGIFSIAINTWDETTDLFESIFGIGKYVVIILAVLIIIPAFILMMNIAKNPVGTLNAIK